MVMFAGRPDDGNAEQRREPAVVEVRFMTEETPLGLIMVDRLYTPEEVATILRLDRVNSVHEIPESMLTPTRVGAKGGKKLYRGRDLLRYLDQCRSIPLEEAED